MTAKPTIHETGCNSLSLRDLGGISFAVTSSFTYRYRAFRRCQIMAQAEGSLRYSSTIYKKILIITKHIIMTNKRKLYQTFLMTMVMMLLFPLTAVAESVGYAVFNSVSNTLTFKYGEKPNAGTKETVYDLNEGNNDPRWCDDGANESITKVVFDASFRQAQPTTCYAWFNGCSNLTSIEGIENLNTSSVTDMSFMFEYCSELTSLDLSYFNTSKVTAMVGMFEGCVNLTTIYVSNYFQTDQVLESENMFNLCTSLEGIIPCDGQFYIDKTYANFTNGYFLAVPYVQIDESRMYFKCDGNVKPDGAYSLNEGTQTPGWSDKALKISYVGFDESFKYIRPTSCYKWFSGFSYLTDLDLSYLNTSKVTNMSEMFKDCSGLTKIIVSDKFTTDNVQSSNDMFAGCTSLEGIITCDGINNIDKTYANFTNGYLSAVPYATLSDGVLTFKCDGAKLGWALGDGLPGWNFANPNSITKVVFDESFKNARPTSCLDWFFECSNLNTIEGFENFNTSKVTNMREMFKHCHGLKSLDLTNFDTSKVTDMGLMFYDCPRLTTIYVSDKFTTDNVQKSEEMFSGCTSLSGAITCDGTTNIDGTYANYFTGYFTYGIKSADDLASFAECVNTAGKDGGEAVLLNDITMTAEDNFTPITCNYTGKFDGQGHTINGLNFSESNNCLFAQNGGTIKNLGIVNAKIAEGATGGICQTNSGTMEKCFFMATTTSSEGETMPNGAVCQTNKGTITRCYYLASNEVSNGGKTAEQFEGGAVCYLLNDGMTNGTQTWYQNIDNGANDAYPVIDNTHGTVYPCTPCTGVYSNTVDTQKDHEYPTEFDGNGFMKCSHCEATQYKPATLNASGEYEIGNAGQLYWFANKVNTENATYGIANAVLTADITVNKNVLKADGSIADDVSGFISWTPIGNSDNKYTGTFDGKGHTVSGLYFNDTSKERVGLFGRVVSGGKISNVGVLDSYFQFNMFGGGVCGYNSGEINNCYSFSTVINTNGYGGGVCGYNSGGKILNSYNNGIVSGNGNTGGVCGNNDDNGEITNCYNSGTISGTGDDNNTAGVCGYNDSNCTISGCYNTGAVSGQNSGGVCFDNYGTIKNCYNTGSISGQTVWGGVCGSNTAGTVMSCYNSGVVNEIPGEVGGICGSIGSTSSTINCYFDSKICSGVAIDENQGGTVDNVEGKSLTQFASGEVCYLLNGSSPYGEWGQQIYTNDYPVLGSAYKVLRAAQDGQNGTNYWATFSNLKSNAELIDPKGDITVYNATVSSGTLTLTERGDKKVAKEEGVLLKANSEYVNAKNISDEVSAAKTGENDLVATPATAQTVEAGYNYTLYRLTYNDVNKKEDLGFYLSLIKDANGNVVDSSVGKQLAVTPGKAYLNVLTSKTQLPSSTTYARSFAFPRDNGGTTGIGDIVIKGDAGINGSADGDGSIYDLQGRKVSKPAKGVYIKNNKLFLK